MPFELLVDQVSAFLDDERPHVVVTFGPDGVTGHPDHVAIGAATDAAFHRVRQGGGPGLRRLLHGAIQQSWFDRHQAFRLAQTIPPWQPDRLYHLRAVPDSDIGIHVRINSVADRIIAGLRAHRSQSLVLMPTEVDVDTFKQGLRHEWHAVAWPPRGTGIAPLTDIFEDL